MKFSRSSLSMLLAWTCSHVNLATAQCGNSTSPPVNYGMVLFPSFQALDVFGPLDILNMLSLSHPMNLYLIAATLDPVSTAAMSASMNPLNSNFSESIVPTHTFADPPPDLDVLIVPGGLGTRAPAPRLDELIGFIRDVYPSLEYLISVCTGAGLVARAGVLDGRNATTNKRAWAQTVAHGPATNWIGRARWVVDENVWTSSGVSAGMDATLAWVAAVFGEEQADSLALGMEYERVSDPSNDPFADYWGVEDVPPVRVPLE
ncbi:DJ-1/PfpI family protein [Sodiomyces alkalinus F11]|uniref:DJ-1/PfpI family protein n=1 Tax=Sodiomyces alkalinus (strain CBS 110278 / VKM F-3762 / F11) TaxID=1314773 RepID=A0A3N2PS43_SODAK|nr:DJ-1/PfpI family protein [Sodiomyces alkalinus F11]ROT37341.1 DJ-1/PfpI family protein [Sodiomyces alkalinus F11]